MKIKEDDYAILKTNIMRILEQFGLQRLENEYEKTGLSPQRLRWNVLYASRVKIGDGVGTQGDVNLYAYMNDDHIDTALRSIFKEAGGVWSAEHQKPKTNPTPKF